MADTDLPVTGKDVTLTLSIDGVPVQVVDQVTSFTAEAVYADVEHKPLGTPTVFHDAVHEGWSGTIELAVSRATLDEMMDAIHAASRTRVPMLISIKEKTNYRNLTSKTYIYPDCKLGFSKSITRGEAGTVSIPWRTGLNRIAA